MTLTVSDFDYELDAGLIAQQPAARRDASRLMVLRRPAGELAHHVFAELPGLLRAGDLIVVNDTRVIPARFSCRRRTGGRIEGLFLREPAPGHWEVLLKNAGRCRQGEALELSGAEGPVELALVERREEGNWLVAVRPARPAGEVLASA
ncbi:MAG: S-adenosylmethionine:tRNA ribosyltransferase-isomerase, partial [Phycisphaerae bacterium]